MRVTAMYDVVIAEHALKHGLDPDDIEYAWFNYCARRYRGAPNEGEVVAVGYDRAGRMIELVAALRPFGTVIFHAMRPPTRKVLAELDLLGGKK
jgi:hypothetical protein